MLAIPLVGGVIQVAVVYGMVRRCDLGRSGTWYMLHGSSIVRRCNTGINGTSGELM